MISALNPSSTEQPHAAVCQSEPIEELITAERADDVEGACFGKISSRVKGGVSTSDAADTYMSYDNLSRPPSVFYPRHELSDDEDIPNFEFDEQKEPADFSDKTSGVPSSIDTIISPISENRTIGAGEEKPLPSPTEDGYFEQQGDGLPGAAEGLDAESDLLWDQADVSTHSDTSGDDALRMTHYASSDLHPAAEKHESSDDELEEEQDHDILTVESDEAERDEWMSGHLVDDDQSSLSELRPAAAEKHESSDGELEEEQDSDVDMTVESDEAERDERMSGHLDDNNEWQFSSEFHADDSRESKLSDDNLPTPSTLHDDEKSSSCQIGGGTELPQTKQIVNIGDEEECESSGEVGKYELSAPELGWTEPEQPERTQKRSVVFKEETARSPVDEDALHEFAKDFVNQIVNSIANLTDESTGDRNNFKGTVIFILYLCKWSNAS